MPRSRSLLSLPHQAEHGGLTTVLDTDDFDCWESAVASTLGHHRSTLLSPGSSFQARFQSGQLGPYGVLVIRGRGRLRLCREQVGRSVLWLPLRGMSEECVNGQSWLAEPGTGLLFQPGDGLEGRTTEELEGLSILLPAEPQGQPHPLRSPLLAAGPLHQQVLASARALLAAAAAPPPGAVQAADQFTEALRAWLDGQDQPAPRERVTARRRREAVEQARQWMRQRLGERFGVVELSQALEMSPRQLQYNFLQELGRSPMAEAKRLRLQRLNRLLLDREQDQRNVAELMVAAGLMASGTTAADYRRWFGERPLQTRLRRLSEERSTPTPPHPWTVDRCG